jgi:hypothetical protein
MKVWRELMKDPDIVWVPIAADATTSTCPLAARREDRAEV